MEPVVCEKLTKRYGEVVAVQDLDLVVRAGEVYGFLGPNGAGKTTTLRMLLGLVRPTGGRVLLHGQPPGDLTGVGAMIEGPAFYPYLSGRDNLRVLASYAGVDRRRIDVVLDLVDLAARSKHKYATYSLGMKQRLGVAAALLKDPQLLILDEPTNGLDPAGMADMRALIRRLGAAGSTVLISSHLLGEVEQICDRVGIISHGRLIEENTVAELRGGAGAGLRIQATPVDNAVSWLRLVLGPDAVTVVDGTALDVTVDPSRAGEINESLVKAGVTVSELRARERDLEQVFLELTGGESNGR
ncbi:ABC transporter ATP-binding protein [Asanoa sp. NPDC050611]|uniref:ABC transporter ATP-binding protein n=1 Tax=Asanoa sp. NPDC050611 TaxID=3157098 RepID=UPI0033E11864